MVGCAEEERVCVGGGGLVYIRQITLCGLTNLTLGVRTLCARRGASLFLRPAAPPSYPLLCAQPIDRVSVSLQAIQKQPFGGSQTSSRAL